MRSYRRFVRPFRPAARCAATRHATEQYRASERRAMNRSPQLAQVTRRTGWPHVGHRSGDFLAAMAWTVTTKALHLQSRPSNISLVTDTLVLVR